MDEEPKLILDLDGLYTDGYFYTSFDIGGAGHSILIEAKNKEAFLDEFTKIFRTKIEEFMTVHSEDD